MIRDIIHLNLNVTDIKRSLEFYEAIGFKVLHVFGDREGSDVEEGMAFQGGRSVEFGFYVQDPLLAFFELQLLFIGSDTRCSKSVILKTTTIIPAEAVHRPRQSFQGQFVAQTPVKL